MSKKEKNCLNCRIHWDREGCCEVCRWEDNDHPSLFYQITRSPEVLAEEFVEMMYDRVAGDYRYYSMLTGEFYNSREEAITATVAKLKEVKNEQPY